MSKNVWFTATVGSYTPEKIKNSFLSFRKFNKEAHIVSIVDDTSIASLKDFFNDLGVEPLHLPKFDNLNFALNWRHSLYTRWLFANPQYEHILLCDARDAVFQDDYFKDLPEKYVYFFQEDSGVTIASEPNNYYWFSEVFGHDVLNQIGNQNIICCGTIAGSRLEFLEFSNYINTEVLRLPPHFLNGFGVDQVITNYAYHTGALNNMPIIKKINGDKIGTLHCSINCGNATDKIFLNYDEKAVFVNGNKPSIIHQYDRSPILQEYFDNLYPLSS